MPDRDDLKLLRIVMVLVGVIFIAGIYPLMITSGWTWHTGHSDYPLMIVGIYATLGVFPLIATRNPLENLSLIWLTVWSSLVHASIMAIQSFEMPENHGHLLGDVPALIVVAVALAALVRIDFFRLTNRSAAVPDLLTRHLADHGCVLSRF